MTERLRELLAAATPGPWWHARSISYRAVATLHPTGPVSFTPPQLIPQEGAQGEADAAYIAACDPDTIRELLDAHDRMAGALRTVQWVQQFNNSRAECPWCGAFREDGHEPHCRRQAALAVPKEETPRG